MKRNDDLHLKNLSDLTLGEVAMLTTTLRAKSKFFSGSKKEFSETRADYIGAYFDTLIENGPSEVLDESRKLYHDAIRADNFHKCTYAETSEKILEAKSILLKVA